MMREKSWERKKRRRKEREREKQRRRRRTVKAWRNNFRNETRDDKSPLRRAGKDHSEKTVSRAFVIPVSCAQYVYKSCVHRAWNATFKTVVVTTSVPVTSEICTRPSTLSISLLFAYRKLERVFGQSLNDAEESFVALFADMMYDAIRNSLRSINRL